MIASDNVSDVNPALQLELIYDRLYCRFFQRKIKLPIQRGVGIPTPIAVFPSASEFLRQLDLDLLSLGLIVPFAQTGPQCISHPLPIPRESPSERAACFRPDRK